MPRSRGESSAMIEQSRLGGGHRTLKLRFQAVLQRGDLIDVQGLELILIMPVPLR